MAEPGTEAIVFLCECGPIIRDLVDLDALGAQAAAMPGVGAVVRHATLCSPDGREFVTRALSENPGRRPVFAACTPREHAETLGAACEAAGVNRHLAARANIREQCAWVTPDRAEATAKAGRLVRAAVARALENEPLTAPEIECQTGVLVLGAGVAGMNAALALADAGRKVTLVERSASIGGRVVRLGEIYPDMDCAPCLLEPVMDRVLHHPGIELLLNAELSEVLGYLGNYTARITVKPRHVDVDGCYGCRSCSEACPVEMPDPVNCGMTKRKAIHIEYPGAMPNASVLDESACLRFNGGECDACASACAFGAIDLDATAEIVERVVGGVVVATGSEVRTSGDLWDSPDALTTLEFERIMNPDGPTEGRIVDSRGGEPQVIALVHCADETGCGPVETCSKTCCLSLAKAAHEIATKLPNARVLEFTWDRVLGGPHYAGMHLGGNHYIVRSDDGTRLTVRPRPAGGVTVTFTRGGEERTVRADLAVVATPQGGSEAPAAGVLGASVDPDGFVLSASPRLRPYAARKGGVFAAGSAQGPKDVTAASAQGAAAAGGVLASIVEGRTLVLEAGTAFVMDEQCGGCSLCRIMCPYGAIGFDEERRVAVIDELLCQGCGTCAAACPSSAIVAKGFTDVQVGAEIQAFAAADSFAGAQGT